MIETCISWNGHTFAPDYEADFVQGTQPRLPPAAVAALERSGAWPVVTALQRKKHTVQLLIKITDYGNLDALRTQLFRWFDPEDETPKALVVENHNGIPQYVYALCEELRLYSDPRHQEAFVVTLTVDGDPRWRADCEAPDTWNITATGDTHTIVNTGEDDAYPIFEITPTDPKGSGYQYRRWIPILWNVNTAHSNYSMEITSTEGLGFDHAALVGAGKALASGDDLRVEVDGLQVDRWLDNLDTANCKVWANLSFQAAQSATLIGIAGTTMGASTDISGFPSSGILYIDTEAFTYTSKNNTTREFFGVTDGAKGTTPAGHAPGATIYWIQHDVWLLYGNATATAPTADDSMMPAFDLNASTNWEWMYEDFAAGYTTYTGHYIPGVWSQRWTPMLMDYHVYPYGGDHGIVLTSLPNTPWEVLGLATFPPWENLDIGEAIVWVAAVQGRFYLYNPCGILEANFIDGEKCKQHVSADWAASIDSSPDGASWVSEYSIAAPIVAGVGVWEAWNQSQTLVDGSKYVGLYLRGGYQEYHTIRRNYLQADTCIVTLNNSNTPTVELGDEQGVYPLACRITNNDTDEAIDLAFTIDMNEALEVDTDGKTVMYLHDNSNQLQALTFVGGVRRNWLRLIPGANELQFDDPDTAGVTITTTFHRRYY